MRYYILFMMVASEFAKKTSAFAFVKSPIALNHRTKEATTIVSADIRRRRRIMALKNHIDHVSPLQYKESSEADPEHITKEAKAQSIVSSLFNHDVKNNVAIGTPSDASVPTVVLPTPEPLPGDCDVKSYINEHVKFYGGDATFLAGPTPRTKKALEKCNNLLTKEREAGGVLSVDTETPSTITSHAPGYLLSEEEDVIVGLQADEPLKRTCKPHGGYGVVKKALEAYGYEPGEKLKAFKEDVVTHNDLTFSMYTDKVREDLFTSTQ